jgi:hypothetical protein
MLESERFHSWVSRQPLACFRMWLRNRPGFLGFAARSVLLLVLLATSVWMLTMIPPLWRDIDAHGEVAHPFGPETILLHGPLYSFVARLPLFLGYSADCWRAGRPLPTLSFFAHPILSDSGVFALLVTQHLALCCSAFYLLTLASRIFWVQLVLAIIWAANPLFYSFAHTVGAEALSMILLLLLGATALRMVRSSGNICWKQWFVFGVLLYLLILTRHINGLLAALLPTAFLILAACQLMMVRFAQCRPDRPKMRWARVKQALRQAMIAVGVGVGCIVLANASVRLVCRAVRIPYYSTLGVSFLFRLKFLAALPPEKRNQLLDGVSRHASSVNVMKIISLLRGSFPTGVSSLDVKDFNQKTRALLFAPQTDPYDEKYAVLLNRTAWSFLCPPNYIFLGAVAADFKRSQEITIPDVVGFLFVTTRYYFSHRESMPQCASLVTFRGKDADQVFAIFKKHSFFRRPKNLTYRALLCFWLVSFALFVGIAKVRKQEAAGLASYATALTAVGLLMMLANCFLAVYQPRYTLPMWELTIISVTILFGGIMDALFSSNQNCFACEADGALL